MYSISIDRLEELLTYQPLTNDNNNSIANRKSELIRENLEPQDPTYQFKILTL